MVTISDYSELQYTQSIHVNFQMIPCFQVRVVIKKKKQSIFVPVNVNEDNY